MDNAVLVEVLVATGALSALSEAVRWWLGRGKTKVDSAQVVQGMAIDLLKPLHAELAAARESVVHTRAKLSELEAELDNVIYWALIAKQMLDRNEIVYPAPPPVVKDKEML